MTIDELRAYYTKYDPESIVSSIWLEKRKGGHCGKGEYGIITYKLQNGWLVRSDLFSAYLEPYNPLHVDHNPDKNKERYEKTFSVACACPTCPAIHEVCSTLNWKLPKDVNK